MSTQKRGQVAARPQSSRRIPSHQRENLNESLRGLSTLGQAALGYAQQGFGVIPCEPRGKGPLLSKEQGGHGVHDATTDPKLVAEWWRRYPDANIGLVPPKGMVVVDVDPRNGGTTDGLPPTLAQKTGGKGQHLLYSNAPRRLPGKLRKGVDIKANGKGYILAEPSVHPNGQVYHWVKGFDPTRVTPFPIELVIFDTGGGGKANGLHRGRGEGGDGGEELGVWSEHQLDEALKQLSSDDYKDWVDVGMILRSVYGDTQFDRWVEWSSGSDKFPGEGECRKKWQSFNRHDKGLGSLAFMLKEKGKPPVPRKDAKEEFGVYEGKERAEKGLRFTKATDIEMDRKLWLWPDRIAERSVSLLAGEGGVGKGHITVEIVATITNGGLWPDDRLDTRAVSGDVLWFCAEDDPRTELKPRLVAAKVDLEKVHLFLGKNVGKDKKEDTTFSIEEDLALLDKHLTGLKNVRLVIFDPVTSYLHGRKSRAIDSHNATQLRAILQPLSELSHKHDVAILGITHFAKDSARRMIHRVVGSQVWTAVARSVLLATKLEPEMRSEKAQNGAIAEYVMMSGKSNNAAETPAIRYQIQSVSFSAKTKKFPKGTAIETSRLIWTEVDKELREEDLFGKSEHGPRAVKHENLKRAVMRIFDEQPEDTLSSTFVIKRLVGENFGTESRISKDLSAVPYLKKKRDVEGWVWTLVKDEG